jgi:CubicO group peptidase (beta-lactamase class C family)
MVMRMAPRDWVRRSRGSDKRQLAVGALGPSGYGHCGYANQWWTLGGPHRAFAGLGIHGQYLYVDPVDRVVIVKLSAWPQQDDEGRDRETIAALRQIAAGVAGRPRDRD